MNRREVFRVIGAAAALPAAAREFPKDYDPAKELARADWKPMRVLDSGVLKVDAIFA